MAEPQVFLSYRRDDSAGYARALGDALGRRFGADRVFVDVDDIGAGLAFDAEIERAVGRARVLLVLIGRRWLAAGPDGRPRLEQPGDVVRHEIAAGLAGGLQVVPVLLDGATMPAEAELPEPLRPLARRQALAVDHARFAADLARLEGVVAAALGPMAAEPAPRRTRRAALVVPLALAVAALGAGWGAWRVLGSRRAEAARLAASRALDGRWSAEVRYPWLNAPLLERFRFEVLADGRVHGSAGFLGVERTIEDGRLGPDGQLGFVTRSEAVAGAERRTLTHHYRGRLVDGELRLELRNEGGFGPAATPGFVARRAP